jgi:lysozyme
MTPDGRERLRQQLIRDEGLHLYPYLDTKNKLTVGIGHNLTDGGLPSEIVEALYEYDWKEKWDALLIALPWVAFIGEPRQAALLNMAFNMGVGSWEKQTGLLGFRKMLAAAETGDWATAAREALDSDYADDVGDRARRVAQQLETGAWT